MGCFGSFGVALILLFQVPIASAQEPLHDEIQGQVKISLVDNERGDTLSPNTFWAYYSFQSYAEEGVVGFNLGELTHNGVRVDLANWVYETPVLDINADSMSRTSTSDTMLVSTGDTIQYYREFMWQGAGGGQTLSSFFSRDTLEYHVNLRIADSDSLVAVLDSIGVLADTTSGSPTFYGSGPAMAITTYVVPAVLSGKVVYLDIDVESNGPSPYYVARYHPFFGLWSRKVTDSVFASYYDDFNGNLSKRIPERLESLNGSATTSGCGISVVPEGGVRFLVTLPVEMLRDVDSRANVMVYDIVGNVVGSHSFEPRYGTPGDVSVSLAQSGVHFVVLVVQGEPICVQKFIAEL